VAPGRLKDRILTLLADNGKRAAISQAALQYARAYSLSTAANAYLDALGLG
jgi:hypothetical protein